MNRADLKAVAIPTVLLAAGLAVFVRAIHPPDPIDRWLLWPYLGLMAAATALAVACLCGGFVIAGWIGARALPMRECLMQSFMLGVLAFAFAVVGVGLVGALGGITFCLLPLLFVAAGARPLARYCWRGARRVARLAPRRMSAVAVLGVLYALACFAGLYLDIMTPAGVAYDARWYHLPIAEHYATGGRIARFEEGWFPGALPHLASWLYTWAFTMPSALVWRIELAMHVEYMLLVATVASMPVLVDQLIGRPRVRAAWAAFFLFPGILLYDSNLAGAADHIVAFWAIPMFVGWRRYWRAPGTRNAIVLGAACAGALLTKYQAVYLVAFPAAAIAGRAVWALAKRRPELKPVGVLLGAGLIATAPHWLLNLIWHGHPIYPMMGGTPMAPGLARVYALDAGFEPVGTLADRIWQTVEGVATFGFVPHDWPTFHGERPVFGSLFLPAVVLIPFVRAWKGLVPLALTGLTGAAIWFWTYHQDRYLQAMTPVLAVCVIAVLAAVWRQAWPARPFISVLVALQVMSCADIYFLPTHGMMRAAPIQLVIDLITTGHRKAYDARLNAHSMGPELGDRVPAGSKVLLHEQHLHLGLGVPAVRDSWPRQGALNYAALGTPAEITKTLRAMGVTHVLWTTKSMGIQRFADEVAFFRFVQVALKGEPVAWGMELAPLPAGDLPTGGARVVVLGCSVATMTTGELLDRLAPLIPAECPSVSLENLEQAIAAADIVVIDPRRHPVVPASVTGAFQTIFARDGLQVWGRIR